MKKNYKSVLGLNTVKAFIVVMLALAIISVVTLIILGTLSSDSLVSQVGRTMSGTTVNETLTTVTHSGEDISVYDEVSAVCSNLIVINSSSSTAIPATNFTQTNCNLAFKTGQANVYGFNNSDWKVTYDYSYKNRDEINGVTDNVSTGIVGFFGNVNTFFALLGIVVIILIISLVVVVVNRFGGGSASGDNRPSL